MDYRTYEVIAEMNEKLDYIVRKFLDEEEKQKAVKEQPKK